MIAVVDFKLVEFVPDSRRSYQMCRSREGKSTGARRGYKVVVRWKGEKAKHRQQSIPCWFSCRGNHPNCTVGVPASVFAMSVSTQEHRPIGHPARIAHQPRALGAPPTIIRVITEVVPTHVEANEAVLDGGRPFGPRRFISFSRRLRLKIEHAQRADCL